MQREVVLTRRIHHIDPPPADETVPVHRQPLSVHAGAVVDAVDSEERVVGAREILQHLSHVGADLVEPSAQALICDELAEDSGRGVGEWEFEFGLLCWLI